MVLCLKGHTLFPFCVLNSNYLYVWHVKHSSSIYSSPEGRNSRNTKRGTFAYFPKFLFLCSIAHSFNLTSSPNDYQQQEQRPGNDFSLFSFFKQKWSSVHIIWKKMKSVFIMNVLGIRCILYLKIWRLYICLSLSVIEYIITRWPNPVPVRRRNSKWR